jgi:hypothetical protein
MLWIVEFNFEREWELQRASMRDGFIYRSLFDNQAWNSSGNVHVHGRLGWLFMHCISHVSKILLILGWYRWLLNVIFFFIRYEWRMIWFYSLFFSYIQQGAFFTISDTCMLQVEKLLGLFEFCFCWELSLGCEIAWSHKEECECRHSLALVVDLQI